MKVYATIMSERAQKGQGGKSLRIQLQGEGGQTLAYLNLKQSEAEPDQYELSIENRSSYLAIVEDGQEIGTGALCSVVDCKTFVDFTGDERYYNGLVICNMHAAIVDGAITEKGEKKKSECEHEFQSHKNGSDRQCVKCWLTVR